MKSVQFSFDRLVSTLNSKESRLSRGVVGKGRDLAGRRTAPRQLSHDREK
jgi:hypothetical protein